MDSTASQLLQFLKTANKRLFVIAMSLLIALILTNGYWIWNNSQWEYEITYEVDTQDNGGAAIIHTGEGDLEYGQSKDNNNEEEETTEKENEN